MIDTHTHILPSIDDGPSNMEESLKIIKKGIKEGITTFVVTPHIRDKTDWNRIGYIKETFDGLKRECKVKGLSIHLLLGAEILLSPEIPKRLMENPEVIIDNCTKKYVLIELPFLQLPIYTEDVLYELLIGEYTPIIAHPERHLYLKSRIKMIERWVENGVKLQVNTSSLNGSYGKSVNRFAKKLLKKKLVHFMGSDVHSIDNFKTFRRGIMLASELANVDYSDMKSF